MERSTLASEALHGDDIDDTFLEGTESLGFPSNSSAYRDYYELLCLPKETSLSPDQVWQAAHRLIQVLAVDRQPPRLQSSAAFYLGLTQAAFETLVDPARRLGYDLSGADEPDAVYDEVILAEGDASGGGSSGTYESKLQEQYLLLTQRESRPSADLSLRVDATSLLASQHGSRRHGSRLEVLDFSIRKATTATVPALRRPIEKTAMLILELAKKDASGTGLHLADPTVTITGATHGLLDGPFKLAPLLLDHYQPPGPSIHGRRRMEQLLASRFLPVLSINLRQDVFWKTGPRLPVLPNLVIEQELELLPQPSTTTRIGHSINLPGGDEPLNVEVSAQKLLTRRSNLSPSLGLAVHRRVGSGTAFLVADGGDWNLRTSKECRELSKFSRISGGLSSMADVFRNPPTVEVGYAFGRHDLGMQSGQAFTKPAERGLASLDSDIDENKPSSWTISTGLTPGNAAAYLRYGCDLFSSSFLSPTRPKPNPKSRPFHAEAELAATTSQTFHLALRLLKPLTRSTKAGLELSLTPTNIHLSLYYSHLSGQRLTLPILLASPPWFLAKLPPRVTKLLWSTLLLPLTLLAAYKYYSLRRYHHRPNQPTTPKPASTTSTMTTPLSEEKRIQAHITAHRAEADALTAVLATGVEARQERARRAGGLVIVSGKFGERGAVGEEVADVSVALAALVVDNGDDGYYSYDCGEEEGGGGEGDGRKGEGLKRQGRGGRLVIPAGVRKGRLLGFWDPAPGRRMVLMVLYLWRGREAVVEVEGREELRLP
jgi:DnaJ family protein C protein 11